MNLYDWILTLEPPAAGYARQCVRYWNGTNGDHEPEVPYGMSKAKADTIKYHVQALNNGSRGKRKVETTDTVSFRWPEDFKNELMSVAAQMDITLSELVLRCVCAGIPLVREYPQASRNFFEDFRQHLLTARDHSRFHFPGETR